MKIALVHEFLNQMGGAERVLENFLEIWPDATVHVILYNKDKTFGRFENTKKNISFLNSLPLARQHPRLFLGLMPSAIESFSFDDFDLVLSDSSSFAKGAKTGAKMHICYCHTPTRFLWTEPEYVKQQKYPALLKQAGKLILPALRRWDYKAAQRPDFLIANSENVRRRINLYYHRDAVTIMPPVDAQFFQRVSTTQDYFFTAARLEPYKRVDLVIQAFNELKLPLKVGGTGTDVERLKKLAGPTIEFLGRLEDTELRQRYSEAKAFIFPAEEDAGIMPLEASACGTPVIAYGVGGSLETVKAGISGEFFYKQDVESIKSAIENFDSTKYDPVAIRNHALQYDKPVFQKKIREFVESHLK
jgi:glycosyltransferase involved in cell wall biosynthesis